MQLREPDNAKPTCYVCGSPAGRYRRYVNNNYSIIKCGQCGLEYTDPVPTEATLKTFYSHYQDIRAEPEVVELNAREHLRMLGERYGWTPESSVLDFGAGGGSFVELAGGNCYGVELQPSANPRIKGELDELGHKEWDFITMWGVLEHLPRPKQVVRDLAASLRSGGMIALTTVDAEGAIPYYYKPPEHLSYWTRAAFEVMSMDCGLEVAEYQPYHMFQLGRIYAQRLLSRTPEEYGQHLLGALPEVVYVPTNEVRVVMRKTAS